MIGHPAPPRTRAGRPLFTSTLING